MNSYILVQLANFKTLLCRCIHVWQTLKLYCEGVSRVYICICNRVISDLQINDDDHHLQPHKIMYSYMYIYVHKYVCSYMHLYKHVYVYMSVYMKTQMPNHQIISY